MPHAQPSLTAGPSATPRAGGRRFSVPTADLRPLPALMALEAELEGWVHEVLAAFGRIDPECAVHSLSCARLAHSLARALGWQGPALRDLTLAALLHDIGKLSVPQALLAKPGRLTLDEHQQMQRHTEIGATILGATALPSLDLPSEAARSHHERWDGGGYPDGLSGTRIPWVARIVAVVDVYDALRRPRPYRTAIGEGRALILMRRGGRRQFDPDVLEPFLALDPSLRRVETDSGRPAP